jgi:hypothetical protein
MKEVFLVNRLDALVPASEEAETALRSYPLGAQLRVKITQRRSLPHHNFYWAFIGETLLHWPAGHGHKPRDDRHLHSWLAVKAGFFEHVEFVATGMTEAQILFSLRMARVLVEKLSGGRPYWPKIEGQEISFAWPMSIRFERMDEEEFKRFTTAVFTVIYSEVGIDVDDYYEAWQKKHGALKVKPERKPRPEENGLYFS